MKVPVYERQVSDAGPVQFRQQTISSEGAVAIADKARERGNVALAYGLKNFGEGLNVLQENRDSAIVSKAVSEYTRQVTDANYNPESGFLHARGAAADGVAQRVVESNKKIRDSVTKGMSGRQLQKFNNATDGFSRNSELTAMRYEQGAMQEYRTEEAKKSLSNLITAIAVNPDMDLGAQSGLMLSISEALHGKSDDENIRLENFKKTEQMVVSGVALEIAQTDPLRAEDYLKKNGSALEPGERQALQLKIDKVAKPVKYDIQAGELYSKHGLTGYGAAIEEIEKSTPEGADRDGKISALSQLYALKSRVAKEEMGNAETEILALCYDKNSRSEAMKYAAAMGAKFEKEYGNAGREWRIMQQDSVDRIFGTGRHAPKSGGSGAVIFQRGAAQRWCVKNVPGFLGMEPAQQEAAMRKKVGITDQDYQDTKAVLTSQYITGLIGREEISNACTNLYMTREDVNRAEILKRTVGTNLKNTVSDLESDIDKCFFGSKGASVNIRGVANKMTQKDAIAAKNIFRNEVFSIYTSGIDLTSEKVYDALDTAQKKAMADVISRKGNLKSRFGFTTDIGKAVAAIQSETPAAAAPKIAVKAPKKKGVELQNALMAK